MKKYWLLLISTVLLFGWGCSEKSVLSIPSFESVEFNPSVSAVYGDSVVVKARVNDEMTPLSTFYTEVSYGGSVLYSKHIRTKGNSADINYKFPIPFAPQALDNTDVRVLFKSINIEGGEVSKEYVVRLKRPVLGNKLYVKFDDKSVVELTQRSSEPMSYVSPDKVYYKNSAKMMISNTPDFSGIVWSWDGKSIVTALESGQYIDFKNTSVKIKRLIFDTQTFIMNAEGDPMPEYKLNNTVFALDAEYYDKMPVFIANIKFEKDKEVTFSGFSDITKAYNPDFFRYKDGKLTFVAESGSYQVVYAEEWNYMYLSKPAAKFPECLWICGTGLALPFWSQDVTSSSWGFGFLQAHYVRRVRENVYQVTLWLQSNKSKDLGVKFFSDTSWGGEIGATDCSVLPLGLESIPSGDFVSNDSFVSGFYRLTLDISEGKGSYILSAVRLNALQP